MSAGSLLVRTSIFGVRNVKKTKEGHLGRAAVALGQAKNVFDSVKELDCGLAKSAQSASTALHTACKKDVLIDGFYKVADKCSHNINPLIWASAGLDILLAEDKEEALVENIAAVGTMRVTEEIMNKYLDKGVDKVVNAAKKTDIFKKVAENSTTKELLSKIKTSDSKLAKIVKKMTKGGANSVLKGVLFVIGSCLAYDIGKKFADNVLLDKDKDKDKNNVQQQRIVSVNA